MSGNVFIKCLLFAKCILYINSGSCKGDVPVKVNLKYKRFQLSKGCRFFLQCESVKDQAVIVCEVFPQEFSDKFIFLDENGGDFKNLNGIVLFECESKDIDNKKKKSYVAFSKMFTSELTSRRFEKQEVKFSRIPLFVEDEKEKGVFIINSGYESVLTNLITNNEKYIIKYFKPGGTTGGEDYTKVEQIDESGNEINIGGKGIEIKNVKKVMKGMEGDLGKTLGIGSGLVENIIIKIPSDFTKKIRN